MPKLTVFYVTYVMVYDGLDGIGRQYAPVFGKKDEHHTVQNGLRLFKQEISVELRVVLYNVLEKSRPQPGIFFVKLVGYLLFLKPGIGLELQRNVGKEILFVQEVIQKGETLFIQRKEIELLVSVGVFHIEAELLEVGGDNIPAGRLVVLVAERLIDDPVHGLRSGGLEFDHGNDLALFEYRTVRFPAVADIFLLGYEIVTRRGVERIAQNFDEKIVQETVLVLFLFGSLYIGDLGKKCMRVNLIRLGCGISIYILQMVTKDGLLKKGHAWTCLFWFGLL
ncbi:hypothetical protein MNB_SV-10-1414 [hydrothermal vent metagenome]|uniref:Uncharacterized protein n=1 Tax=hydrothermal vent metagenome TaxID=652676 RepID=A0A1W1CI27_9ZZZZ